MIIIRTNHDTQTNYLYLWSETVIKYAKDRGYTVDKVEGRDITEKNIRSRINNRKPRIIFFNGHGSNTSLINNEQNEFITTESADIFKDTITFTRACSSLTGLGPSAVEKGCKAFIGYRKSFWIVRQHKNECNPLRDEVAKPILEGSNLIIIELLKGKTVHQSIQKSHEHAEKSILELIYSKEPLARASLPALIANDAALGYEGNPETKNQTR
jgi:hypothetical protein